MHRLPRLPTLPHDMSFPRRPLLAGSLATATYFALVLGSGFILGSLRVSFLVPRLGERYAELLEMPLLLVVIVLAARYVVRRFQLPPRPSVRLLVGFAALALALIAELLLAAALQDLSVRAYVASRDPVSGSVYLGTLLLFALIPWLQEFFGGTPKPGGKGS
jgi:hypothetical protein